MHSMAPSRSGQPLLPLYLTTELSAPQRRMRVLPIGIRVPLSFWRLPGLLEFPKSLRVPRLGSKLPKQLYSQGAAPASQATELLESDLHTKAALCQVLRHISSSLSRLSMNPG